MSTNQISLRQIKPGSTNGAFLASSSSTVILKYNLSSATTPASGNDTTQGYSQGSLWYNTTAKRIYIFEDASTGAAVWKSLGTITWAQVIGITGTADSTTFLRGDGVYAKTLTTDLSLGTKLIFTSTTTVTAGNTEITSITNGLVANIATGGTHYWKINNATLLSGSATVLSSAVPVEATSKLTLLGSSGSATAANREIVASSNGVEYNTPSSTVHTFKVNNVAVVAISSSGIAVVADPQDYEMFSARKYR